MNYKEPGFGFKFFNFLVYSRVKARLGLDQAFECASGAAPIQKKTRDFFYNLNIFINNVFGMSETSAPMTGIFDDTTHLYDVNSAGVAIPGGEIFVHKTDPKSETGELCFRGRNIFMGYLKNEIATRETIDNEKRIHSGDEGKVDERGVMFITGRLKELIVTAGGENVAPVPIEMDIKAELPFLSNVMLIGDQKKFISALVTFKVTSPPTEAPNKEILFEAMEEMEKFGVKGVKTVEQAMANEKLKKIIQNGIDAANKKVVSNAARVKAWFIVADDFSVPGGEFTPTMKVKRKAVTQKYAAEINQIYSKQDL